MDRRPVTVPPSSERIWLTCGWMRPVLALKSKYGCKNQWAYLLHMGIQYSLNLLLDCAQLYEQHPLLAFSMLD
jgi:hypothetical protein